MKQVLMCLVLLGSVPALILAADPTTPFDGHYAIPNLNNVQDIKVADFNGDGRNDLLVAAGNDAAIVLANSNETFATPVILAGGSYVSSVTSALLNDDAYLDVVIAADFAGNEAMQVFFGDGAGRFSLDSAYPLYTNFSGLTAADYDDDGDLDLIGASYSSVCLYPNNGDGTFGAEVSIPCGSSGNAAIESADFNKDLLPDIALAGYGADTLYILMNNGSGGFETPVAYYAGTLPHGLIVTDVNNDTYLDVVIANRAGTYISVFTGKADGTLNARVEYSMGQDNYDISAGDFDEDGWVDLAVGSRYNSRLVIMRNNQDGTFTLDRWYENSSPNGVLVAHLDTDTHIDIAVSAMGSYVRILYGDGTGAFPGPLEHFIESGATDFTTGDIDGDNTVDVVFSNGPAHSVYVVRNHGDSTFGSLEATTIPGSTPAGIILADVTNSNGPDLVVADDSRDTLYVLLNNGSGGFAMTEYLATGNNPSAPIAARLNGDAYLDLAVVNVDDNSVSVFINEQDGSFDVATDYSVGDEPQMVAAWNYDGDLDVDLAVAIRNYPATIEILENDGAGAFTPGPEISIPMYLSYLTVVDLEGDGDEDLLASIDGDSLYIVINNGDGTFETPRVCRLSNYAFEPVVGDVDKDGDDDVLLHHGGYEYFTFIGNNGDGALGYPMTWYAGDYLAGVQLADMNGDTYPDIVALSGEYSYDSTMFIYWNQKQLIPVDVDDVVPPSLPNAFAMGAYPNPFNPTQTISFTLPQGADVRLEVFNILGQKVRTLIDASLPAGNHQTTWDGRSDAARIMSTGVYFYRLTADGQYQTHRTLLLK